MTASVPAPLVPPEIDLRDFLFMPLDVRRLLSSETWIDAVDDPRIGHAAMSLWCESWHQVPAGSLPDNDKVLYRLSMCPSPKEWSRVRDAVLRGWVRASDGRLYHRVVAEKALEAWEKKLAQRERTRRATEERERRRAEREAAERRARDAARDDERDVARNDERDVARNDERDVARNDERESNRDVHQGTGTGTGTGTVKGQGQGDSLKPEARSTVSESGTDRGRVCRRLRDAGVIITPQHPLLIAWLAAGATDAQLAEAIERARLHKPPPEKIPAAYLDPIVQEVLAGPAAPRPGASRGGWWASEAATEAKARELGLHARGGESWASFRERIRDAIAAQGEAA